MRRHISKQKQIPISEKVKKMFRYSPSYQAQKCYSKLPLRYSYASNAPKINSLRQDEIHCEYSSVKEKCIETNQCNDTSSWIAKLVSGIQDDDEEVKNFHKLSHIQNQQTSDLPEDSHDYGDNQFLTQQGIKLFGGKNQEMTPQPSKFQQEVPITNPIKKSIKEALIEIQLKESKEGLRGPPGTRANSCSKKENQKISKLQSKFNSNQKNIHKKQGINEETRKSPLKEKSFHKNYSKKSIKSSSMDQTNKSYIKKQIKTLEKFVEKSIQVQNLNTTYNDNSLKNQAKILNIKESLDVSTCKNSFINSGTKKQSIHKIKNQVQESQTRKNSFIQKEELSECKEQYKIVEEHSKNLLMKNLFSEENQIWIKPEGYQQIFQKPQITEIKKIGGIKKNIFKKDEQPQMKDPLIKNIQISQIEAKNLEQREKELQLKSSYLSTKRQSKLITLNHHIGQRILIELDQNSLSSSRRNAQKLSSKRNQLEKIGELQQHKNRQNLPERYHLLQKDKLERQNNSRITALFNKLKLDPTKDFIDKTNLKIRGLDEEQRTELGSIITKIHYQNARYEIDSFSREFRKINVECTLSGCLSQQKLRKNKQQSPKKSELPLDSLAKPKESLKNNIQLSQKDEEAEIMQMTGLGHRRRNSKIIKRKLFQEIKRISYLQEVATNQLEKNSRINEQPKSKENVSSNNPHQKMHLQHSNSSQDRKYTEQYISKDPYVECSSFCDLELSRRVMVSNRNFPTTHPLEQRSNNLIEGHNKFIKGYSQLVEGNDTCLIERLNKKLSSYIDKNQIENTFRQFNLNFSELKKHIR